MTVLSADKDVVRGEDTLIEVPVTDDEIIYKGALVCVDTDGYALAAADTADYKFLGVAYDQQDNTGTGHADGAKKVRVYRRGIFKLVCTGITQNMVGQLMYITDDQTIDNTSTNWICVGRLVKYVSTTSGWVDIGDKSVEPTVSFLDNVELAFGNDQDIVMDWDGTNFNIMPAATGKRVIFGSDSLLLHLRFANSAHLEFYDADNYIYGNGAGQIVIVATNATAAICLMPATGYVYISSDVTMLEEKKLFLRGTTDYVYCNSAGQVHLVGSNATAAIVFAPTSGYTQVTGSVHVTGAIFMDTDSQRINLYSTTEYIYANAAGQIVIVSAGVSTGAIYLQCPSGGATVNGTLNVQDDLTMADDKKIYLYSTTDYIHANTAGQVIIVGSNATAAICLMPSGATAHIYLSKSLVLANLASGIAVEGAVWFDTTDNKMHLYANGGERVITDDQ